MPTLPHTCIRTYVNYVMYTKLSNACSQLVHVSVKGERGVKWKRGGNRPSINYYVCACVCVSVREVCSGCRLAGCSPTLCVCVGVMLLLVHAGIIRYRISPIQHGLVLTDPAFMQHCLCLCMFYCIPLLLAAKMSNCIHAITLRIHACVHAYTQYLSSMLNDSAKS